MRTMISSSLIFSSIPKPQFDIGFRNGVASPSIRRALVVRCSGLGDGEKGKNLKDALSGLVDKQVEELLNREENKGLVEELQRASDRVDSAKRQLAEIERQELEAKLSRDYVDRLEARASEIAECQQEISEARSMVEEAERSLLLDEEGDMLVEDGSMGIDRDQERLESVKAALISAIIGTLVALPISLTQVTSPTQLILPSAVTFISCALFGVTFRYTIRGDLDNFQLKTGTSAAFGIVKGLSELGRQSPLEPNLESFLSRAFDGGVLVAQNLYLFLFSAVALDFCFKIRLLSPFPIKRSAKND